jgi:hypothetical protein
MVVKGHLTAAESSSRANLVGKGKRPAMKQTTEGPTPSKEAGKGWRRGGLSQRRQLTTTIWWKREIKNGREMASGI